MAVEGRVVRQDHPLGIAHLELSDTTVRMRRSSAIPCSIPNRSIPMVDPLSISPGQVVEILAVAAMTDDEPVPRDPSLP